MSFIYSLRSHLNLFDMQLTEHLLRQLLFTKTYIMKKYFFALALGSAAILFIVACNDSKKTDTTTTDTTASTNVNKTVDTTMGKTSNEFVMITAQNGMAEVEMAKQAQANGGSQEVKDFGKMLETDHSQANATLMGIANEENIMLPTSMTDEQANHLKDMGAMKGADFDKHFIDMMIDGHTKSIERFKDAAANNANAKVKDFASKTLPTLQKHLDKAKSIKSKMK